MTVIEFKHRTEQALSKLDNISSINIEIDDKIVSGDALFAINCFVSVYYNSRNIKMSFAIIYDKERIFAIDHDSHKGWHRHPLYNIEVHESIDPMTVEEIVDELAWQLKRIGS